MATLNITVPQSVVLSPTRVEQGLKCARKHVLADILGIVPNEYSAPALDFGDAMHRAAGVWWLSGDMQAALQALELACKWPLDTRHTLELARRLLEIYGQEARLMPYGAIGDWVLETAEKREYLQIEGETLGFQIDRLLRNVHTGALALVDLKTARRCDKRWEVQWRRKLQPKLYSECIARKYGQPPQWFVIEGLEKDKPGVHYVVLPDMSDEVRAEAVRSYEWIAMHDRQILDHCRDADGTVNVDKLLGQALTQTPYNADECFSYNSACQYLPLCDAEPSERLALLTADYHHEAPKHLV